MKIRVQYRLKKYHKIVLKSEKGLPSLTRGSNRGQRLPTSCGDLIIRQKAGKKQEK